MPIKYLDWIILKKIHDIYIYIYIYRVALTAEINGNNFLGNIYLLIYRHLLYR